ncbi:MAG: hypothetical protein IKB79_02060 [Oscillospiraceae bacterium]|nr:hypothetical protein [Oscillospiraceae bacterium]
MRGTTKDIVVIVAVSFGIPLAVLAVACLFAWWLFTGLFLETDAEMMEIPKPPIRFSQYTRQGHYRGHWYDGAEEMEYNEYYYWNVSFADQPNFQPVTQENMPEILTFVQDYEQELDAVRDVTQEDVEQLCREYRYDAESLSPGDYYRVDVWDEEQPFSDYKLYIFDYEANTLYYLYYREIEI